MSAECTLIADRTDDAVQLALGFIALSSLYCKWHFETPRRPTKIWFLDALKQGTSAAMIHVLNIVSAIATADFSTKPNTADECAFYFMNVAIDTTLGVYIAYLLLQLVTSFAVTRNWAALKHPGRYGEPPSLRVWTLQLFSWMAILVVMKSLVAVLIYLFRTPLGWIGQLLFYPVHHHPKVELLIVMIGCPLVMNMVQFWIQDSFLKDHGDATKKKTETSQLQSKVPQYGGALTLHDDKPKKKKNSKSDAEEMYDTL